MTVTVKKIEKPKPPTNPLAFDPDTQPGELVLCISGDNKWIKGEVYVFSKHHGHGHLSVKEIPNDWRFIFCFINVHRLPDGTLVFGRGPAPEKVYTTDEVRRAPVGSLFESTDPEAVYTHARVSPIHVFVTHRGGLDELLLDGGLPQRTWRRLATEHKVKIEYEEEA
jgi:hypothetical protein